MQVGDWARRVKFPGLLGKITDIGTAAVRIKNGNVVMHFYSTDLVVISKEEAAIYLLES